MSYRPIALITLVLLSCVITVLAPVFDSSFYGINGHPVEWLSFSPGTPLRQSGLTLILALFLHINFLHLITNMMILMPVALMIERRKSGQELILYFFLIHFQVLLLLVGVDAFFPLIGKAFLGSSHVVLGLYTFWALNQKKYGMLIIPLAVLGIGIWDTQPLTLLAHLLGVIVGAELFFMGRLLAKLRSKSSN